MTMEGDLTLLNENFLQSRVNLSYLSS